MKTQFLASSLLIVLISMLFCNAARADSLAGVSDATVTGGAIISVRYDGTEYVVANEDLMLGTTTRWYIPAATGIPTLWADGQPVPTATVTGTSDPKSGDVGSKGDNFLFTLNGATNISSIDGINFQETIFPLPTKMIFVFERGGNDNGTVQGILADGSLGMALKLTANGAPYANTGVSANGQNGFGYVFTSDDPVIGLRITASGHDTLSISAVPIRLDPRQSRDSQPRNEATDVPRDVVLTWTPGEGVAAVNGHILYLSRNLADVTDGVGGVTLSDTSYDPGRLEFGATYYWRVDQAGADVFEGEVWSFTVEPAAYPIQNVTATASSAQEGMGPENTVNGSGLNAMDEHSAEGTEMWLSTGVQPNWIQYEFDAAYKLQEMWVWNSNQLIEPFIGFGAKTVTIEYSLDGSAWTKLDDAPEFAQATGAATYTHNTTVPFGGVVAKYVRLTIDSLWGGLTQSGLSEVRFFSIPVQAREPVPADAATDVDIDAVLSWRAGREAASHTVYLSKDENAVSKGTAPKATVADNSFTPATLGYGATYYWRVDEVNEAMVPAVYEGPVWSFTTEAYEIIDDFESYTDDEGNRIYQAWVDGYGTTTNGSQVGYAEAPFAETTIIRGGRQSMPLSYDNSGVAASEAERVFDASQDWTRAGISTLVVYFRGDPNNTTGKLYLKINGVKVVYGGDVADLKAASWTAWSVNLASVNTNLTKVTKLAIGVDSGGQGILYIDDIRLLPAAPVASTTLTVGPASAVTATGNDGMILTINGIEASKLITGTTTVDFEKYADHPAPHADDLSLGTYASLDDSKVITVMFAVPVSTIFIIERGANDSGFIQPLDAAGTPVGEPQPYVNASWFKPGLTIAGQASGAMVITATPPISGINLLPPASGLNSVDPASISAVPAQ
jgi:hypothetical protein